MSNEKIKPKLNGTAETMLQCFYARAMHSRNPKNKFRDTKAEELIDRIDYDFSNAKKDTAMSGGIVVRSVVFDELVSDFIRKNPDCTVVNIACGLDTRFYRMDASATSGTSAGASPQRRSESFSLLPNRFCSTSAPHL